MSFTRAEKERISDNLLKIQAVARSLKHLDRKKVPDLKEIEECLEGADRSLGGTLRSDPSK